ncbi:MAG: acyltransferase [Planctomycetes bacterium]|nr:acyltransferase [Planctomycetota bacterium]MBI3846413.1 acyltransferase [Planctomycetota bacterium]
MARQSSASGGRQWEIRVNHRKLVLESKDAEATFTDFLADVERRLADPKIDRNVLCRDVLYDLYVGDGKRYEDALRGASLGRKSMLHCFDPRNITLESEYYSEIDAAAFAERKPLMWLWIMFDRSPLGQNVILGVQFRALLAKHVFKKCGKNPRIFHNVEFSFGYNLSIGDNVTIHRYVFLDDRGELVIGDNASLSDYVNVYSHSHDISDGQHVTMAVTKIGKGARVTYHSTVLSGTEIEDDGMLGAMGLLTKKVPAHHVSVGIPARIATVKPGHPRVTE